MALAGRSMVVECVYLSAKPRLEQIAGVEPATVRQGRMLYR